MKKKILSLCASAVSLSAVALYAVMALLFAMRLTDGNKFIPDASGDIWIVDVISRISKAGFSVFFTLMAVILCAVLAFYRIMMAYFHFKVFRGDDTFYRERIKDNVLYACLAVIALVVIVWGYTVGSGLVPPEIVPCLLILIIIYSLIIALPIVEIIIVTLSSRIKKEKAVAVPTREGILDELDDLADRTVALMVSEKEDLEIESDEDLDKALIAEGLIDGAEIKNESDENLDDADSAENSIEETSGADDTDGSDE